MQKENKGTQYVIFSLSILLCVLFLGTSVYLIYLTSTINWFLSVIVAFICIILIGVLAWYSIKVWFLIKNIKHQEEDYNLDVNHSNLDVPFNVEYFKKSLNKDDYKYILDANNTTYKVHMFIKKNEASPFFNYLLVEIDSIPERIEFSNDIDKVMLVHDVPNGLYKTIIIVASSSPDKNLNLIYLLNNPYNITHQKYYCVFDSKAKELYLGEDKELTSSDFVKSAKDQLSFVFKTREKM